MVEVNTFSNGVTEVVLNRPEKRNAFDDRVITELHRAFSELTLDGSVRVVVLSARGEHFCAGADLAWMKRMAQFSHAQNTADAQSLANMLRALNTLPMPVVARVQGAAMGGAVGLLSCCDLVVAAETARFALSEVKLGLIPATISPYVIKAIGARASRRYFVTGEFFDAQAALQMGLVTHVVTDDALDDILNEQINALLNNGPLAVRAAKCLVADFADRAIDDAVIQDTSQRIADARVSVEGQEGLAAFLERRAPGWSNGEKA